MYFLKLDDKLRVEYATYEQYASEDMVAVNTMPDGDLHDYLYVNGEYIYTPIDNDNLETVASVDARLSALEDELTATKIILGVE